MYVMSFESFVKSISYKTNRSNYTWIDWFESFVKSISYKTALSLA